MGTWGVGLYQDDEAADIKPLLTQLLRLPHSIDDLIAIARGDDDNDGIVFHLVVADQLERKGIHHAATRDAAIEILRSGADIARLKSLGMTDADLRKRENGNADLLARLENPRPEKPRKTMAKPKPLPVAVGDVVIYPCDDDKPINPYLSDKMLEQRPFSATGWGAFVVADTGFEFGFLPWIGIRRLGRFLHSKPDMASLSGETADRIVQYGTLSPAHMKRMGMTVVGQRTGDGPVPPLPHGHAGGADCARNDISISNRLSNRL